MRISGVAIMHAPADRVWAALNDPAVLVATIPGCERLEPAGPDSYRFTLAAGVASIQGIYTGEVWLSQQQEPSSFVLTASGAGGGGNVSTSVLFTLTDAADGTTELSYDADTMIGGFIAGIGQRLLSSIAKQLAGEFFSSVDALVGTAAVSQAARRAEPLQVPVSAAPVPASQIQAAQIQAAPASERPDPEGPVPAATPPAASLAPGRRDASTASPPSTGFAHGVLAGAAVTLAGVAVRGLIRRRAR
jgi:carbon monoxide dehydrogenase subunit G